MYGLYGTYTQCAVSSVGFHSPVSGMSDLFIVQRQEMMRDLIIESRGSSLSAASSDRWLPS